MMVLWSTISEFCSIKDWHPAIADCKESKEGDATFRVLTLKDNGGTIKERLTGQFRAEALNAFNSPKFANPNTQFGTASFGKVTYQSNLARQLQLGVRFFF